MDQGIGHWTTIHARRNPHRVALIDGDTGRKFMYGELEQRTNALAHALSQKGVRKGDRVAIMALNSPHFMEVAIAVAKLGAILVPINFRLTAPEVRYILDDAAPCILFTSPQTEATAHDATEGSLVRERIEIPSAEQRSAAKETAYEKLIAEGSSERIEVRIGLDEVAALIYTSGTTGFPKGAMLTHGNHFWNALTHFSMSEGLFPNDISLVAAPLFHIGAFGIYTLALIYLGGTSVILESFKPGTWLDAVETYKPTLAFCVPAMWAAIAQAGLDGRDLTSLRYTISGGAPCPLVLIKTLREHGMVFTEGFGLTETAPVASALGAAEVITHAGSVGKPIAHVEYRIVDDAGRDLAVGDIGELLIRGPNVFVGYWQRPEATRDVLQEDGWFHSGDLARVDADGYYTIVDRKKDMVISGGENVYPAEVEQVLYQRPEIAEVAVIGTPDAKWGEAVTAVVALKKDQRLEPEVLIAWARERLAGFKCPRSVKFIDALPRTATGKVLKRELRQRFAGGNATAVRR